jgi:hypothetical protein
MGDYLFIQTPSPYSSARFNFHSSDEDWRDDLRLRPGVEIAGVLKLNETQIPIGVSILERPNILRVTLANSASPYTPTGIVLIDSRAKCAIGSARADLHLLPNSRTAATTSNSSVLIAEARGRIWTELGRSKDCSPCSLQFFVEDETAGGYLIGLKSPQVLRSSIFNSLNFENPVVTKIALTFRFGIYDGFLFRPDRDPCPLSVQHPPSRLLPYPKHFEINLYRANHIDILFGIGIEEDTFALFDMPNVSMGYFDIREDLLPIYNAEVGRADVILLDVSRWKIGFLFRQFCAGRDRRRWRLVMTGKDAELVWKIRQICKSKGDLDLINSRFGDLNMDMLRQVFHDYNRIMGIKTN